MSERRIITAEEHAEGLSSHVTMGMLWGEDGVRKHLDWVHEKSIDADWRRKSMPSADLDELLREHAAVHFGMALTMRDGPPMAVIGLQWQMQGINDPAYLP